MSTGLQFEEEVSRRVEAIYSTQTLWPGGKRYCEPWSFVQVSVYWTWAHLSVGRVVRAGVPRFLTTERLFGTVSAT